MKDKHGREIQIGDKVRYHGRECTVLKFDKTYPSMVEIDDPKSTVKFIGAKKTERPVRWDDLEKI